MADPLNAAPCPDSTADRGAPARAAEPTTCGHSAVLPVRPAHPTPHVVECLTHLYVCRGLSTRRIGETLDVNRQRVTTWLHDAGVPVRPRGAGRARPHRQPEPGNLLALLQALYAQQRLTSLQIGRLLGIPDRRIRMRLAEYGIQRRPRAAATTKTGSPSRSTPCCGCTWPVG